MAYHEINGSRGYEYRYCDNGQFTAWQYAGVASPETLKALFAGLSDTEYEVRQTCHLTDNVGKHVGQLIFSELVTQHDP